MILNIKRVWNFNVDVPVMGIAIGNLLNNREPHLLAYTKSGKILILSFRGTLLLEEIITDNTAIWNGIIEDIDNDNQGELILGGLDGLLRTFKCANDFQLTPFWAHQFGASISGILIYDINKDGLKELIAYSLDKSIRALNSENGALIWGQLFEQGVTDALIYSNTKNHKSIEIIASSNDGTIRSFDSLNGELLWFKRFDNKIRTISNMKAGKENCIVCGGDGKKLHILYYGNKEEIKTELMEDYIWKSLSYPHNSNNNLLISTYSFAFFDENIPVESIHFSSEVLALNQDFNIKWKLGNVNAEKIDYIEGFSTNIVLIGTTKGELFLINDSTGEILGQINYKSCINDFKYDFKSKLLITCHDDGQINAYDLSFN